MLDKCIVECGEHLVSIGINECFCKELK